MRNSYTKSIKIAKKYFRSFFLVEWIKGINMLISRVAPKNQTNLNIKTQISNKKKNGITQNNNQTYLSQFPISYIPSPASYYFI